MLFDGWVSPLTATPTIFLLASVAVLFGSTMQGLSGVGLGLVAAPVIILIDPTIGPGPLLVLAMLMSAIMLIRQRAGIDRRGLALTLTGRVIGSVAAAYIYTLLPISAYGLTFGLLILAGVTMTWLGYEIPRTNSRMILAGITSGVMGTLTSAGSPAIALIYHKASGETVRSTLAAFFFFSSLISLLALMATGGFSGREAVASLSLVPAMAAGFLTSGWLVVRLSLRVVRNLVLGVSALSALVLIGRSCWELV
ncbi:sulfite exporter TauE/SafE family protein [soil metagenome]